MQNKAIRTERKSEKMRQNEQKNLSKGNTIRFPKDRKRNKLNKGTREKTAHNNASNRIKIQQRALSSSQTNMN